MKRLLAFAIAVMMVFAMVPVSVSADEILPTPAAVGGVLTLGEGTYRICTGHGSLDGITEIVGAGTGKTFLKFFNDGGDNSAIYFRQNNSSIKISDITIDGTGVDDSWGFKTQYGVSNVNVAFENVEFKNLFMAVYLDHTSEVTMTNCSFTNCTNGIGSDLGVSNGNLTIIDSTFSTVGESIGWSGNGTLRIENTSGIESFTDYGNSAAAVAVEDVYGEWTRVDGELVFTDIAPEPEASSAINFLFYFFMKRLAIEYPVELVYDETMGIVEIDDEDGCVLFSNDVVVTVEALEGYEVDTVLVNGEAVELDEDGTYTIKRIRKDAKVEVTFVEVVEDAE